MTSVAPARHPLPPPPSITAPPKDQFDPDEQWKTALWARIAENAESLKDDAITELQGKLAAAPVTPAARERLSQEHMQHLSEIYRMAVQTFEHDLAHERLQRRWMGGHAGDEANEILKKEQQGILDSIQKERGLAGAGQDSNGSASIDHVKRLDRQSSTSSRASATPSSHSDAPQNGSYFHSANGRSSEHYAKATTPVSPLDRPQHPPTRPASSYPQPSCNPLLPPPPPSASVPPYSAPERYTPSPRAPEPDEPPEPGTSPTRRRNEGPTHPARRPSGNVAQRPLPEIWKPSISPQEDAALGMSRTLAQARRGSIASMTGGSGGGGGVAPSLRDRTSSTSLFADQLNGIGRSQPLQRTSTTSSASFTTPAPADFAAAAEVAANMERERLKTEESERQWAELQRVRERDSAGESQGRADSRQSTSTASSRSSASSNGAPATSAAAATTPVTPSSAPSSARPLDIAGKPPSAARPIASRPSFAVDDGLYSRSPSTYAYSYVRARSPSTSPTALRIWSAHMRPPSTERHAAAAHPALRTRFSADSVRAASPRPALHRSGPPDLFGGYASDRSDDEHEDEDEDDDGDGLCRARARASRPELRRMSEEPRQKELALHKEEELRQKELALHKEEELRQQEATARKLAEALAMEEAVRLKEEEARRKEAEIRRMEDETRRKEEETRRKEEEVRRREAEVRRKEEALARREAEALRLAAEADARRRREEEQAAARRRREEEEADARRRREEEAAARRRREEEEADARRRWEEEAIEARRRREEDAIEARRRREEEEEKERAQRAQQDAFRRREEEIRRRTDERKRQDSLNSNSDSGRPGAGAGFPSTSPPGGAWGSGAGVRTVPPPVSPAASERGSAAPSGWGSGSSAGTGGWGSQSTWGSSSTASQTSNSSRTSASASASATASASASASASRPTPSAFKPASSPSAAAAGGAPPISEAEWARRQAEQARKQQEQFRREQERLERARAAQQTKTPSREEALQLFDFHERQWSDVRSSRADLTWGAFPWPVLTRPAGPDELTPTAIGAYVLCAHHPAAAGDAARPAKDRVKEYLRRWHPDRFETQLLPKVTPADRARVQAGAGAVARGLNELLARSNMSDVFS